MADLRDILPTLLAGSRFGQGDQADTLAAYQALLEAMYEGEKRKLGEMVTHQDPMDAVERFRNEGFPSRATGVPYIFTGGSPFPQSPGQQQGEKIVATGALATNVLDAVGGVLPALIDAWRKKKGGKS
jgi:hypothetical protein